LAVYQFSLKHFHLEVFNFTSLSVEKMEISFGNQLKISWLSRFCMRKTILTTLLYRIKGRGLRGFSQNGVLKGYWFSGFMSQKKISKVFFRKNFFLPEKFQKKKTFSLTKTFPKSPVSYFWYKISTKNIIENKYRPF